MMVIEPYGAYNYYSDYGFVKIRVGKFFKRPLRSVAKMVTTFTRRPLKAIKKYPLLAAPLVVGGIAAAKAAGVGSYLAPLKAKAVTAKWALKAKLAPVTARVGAFVRHRILGVGAAGAAAALAKKKKPIKKVLKPAVKTVAGEKAVKKGFLSTVWDTVGGILKPGVQTAVEASLAAKLGRTPYRPIDGAGTSTVRVPRPRFPRPPVAAPAPVTAPPGAAPPAQAGVIRAGMFSIPKNMLPLLVIGGVGLLTLLLIAGRGGGAIPIPMYMPYPAPRG